MDNSCRPLRNGEIAKLSARLPSQRDRALFFLGIGTGFRISELLSIRVGDVFREGKILDRVTVKSKSMKGAASGARTVPIPRQAQEHVARHIASLESRDPKDPLFKSRKGGSISRRHASKIFRDAAAAAGIKGKISTHTLRKTFAEKVHEKLGGDIFLTQQALGHKSPASTVHYLSFRETVVEEAIKHIFDDEGQLDLFDKEP